MPDKPLKDEVSSPCVRNCCLNDEDMCLGCFRMLDEIVGWAAKSNDEKRAILAAVESRVLAVKPRF